MIIKKLSKIGNSYGFIVDKTTLGLLNVDESTDFEMNISTESKSIVFSPISQSKRKEALKKASTKFNTRYEKTQKRLAE